MCFTAGPLQQVHDGPPVPGVELRFVSAWKALGWRCRGGLFFVVIRRTLNGLLALKSPFCERVLIVVKDGLIIHYSFVTPAVSRLGFASEGDLEIGGCWTDPDFRGRRLFPYSLTCIRKHFSKTVWVVCREANFSSIRGLLSAGFDPYAYVERKAGIVICKPRFSLTQRITSYKIPKSKYDSQSDKELERRRYSRQASLELGKEIEFCESFGALSLRAFLRKPYELYEERIRKLAVSGRRVLELCAGTGTHSLPPLLAGASTVLMDISHAALQVATKRSLRFGRHVSCVTADGEKLPFKARSFDMVICAGGMSYCDHDMMFNEIVRVLKPGGHFVFVDSFNKNPIYRLNRWRRARRGERTWLTLRRIPSLKTLTKMAELFEKVEVTYHGTFVFLGPVIARYSSDDFAARVVDALDQSLSALRHYAFKIVGQARRRSDA